MAVFEIFHTNTMLRRIRPILDDANLNLSSAMKDGKKEMTKCLFLS